MIGCIAQDPAPQLDLVGHGDEVRSMRLVTRAWSKPMLGLHLSLHVVPPSFASAMSGLQDEKKSLISWIHRSSLERSIGTIGRIHNKAIDRDSDSSKSISVDSAVIVSLGLCHILSLYFSHGYTMPVDGSNT